MIIDYHNHLGGPDRNDGKTQTPYELLVRMDAAGVDMAVVFPFNVSGAGVSFERENDAMAAAAGINPDRIVGFCRLDPNAGEAAIRELERSVNELGLKGVKLHPSAQKFGLDDPKLYDLCAAIESFGLPVVLDTGKKESPPLMAGRLAARFPGMKLILAHMNIFEDTMLAAEENPNVIVGTTGYFNLRRLERGVRRLGAGRFVAGSDSPYISMESEFTKFNSIDITDKERGCITGGNIAVALGFDEMDVVC